MNSDNFGMTNGTNQLFFEFRGGVFYVNGKESDKAVYDNSIHAACDWRRWYFYLIKSGWDKSADVTKESARSFM